MEKYWPKRLTFDDDDDAAAGSDNEIDMDDIEEAVIVQPPPVEAAVEDDDDPAEAFARHRKNIVNQRAAGFSGWQAELRAYNKDMPASAKIDMDLCKYWEVG